ncbi:MAG: hypothetical protein ACRC26_07405 [Bacteroidales bacterium]
MKKNVIGFIALFICASPLYAQVKGSSSISVDGGYTLNNGYNIGVAYEKVLTPVTRMGLSAATLHMNKDYITKNEYYAAPYISFGQSMSRMHLSVAMFPKIGYMSAKTSDPLLILNNNDHFLFGLGFIPKLEFNFNPIALSISYQYAYSFNSIFNSANSINLGLKLYL